MCDDLDHPPVDIINCVTSVQSVAGSRTPEHKFEHISELTSHLTL